MILFYDFDELEYDYEFEVDTKEVREYIASLLADRYGGVSQAFYNFLLDYDNLEEDLEEKFKEDIEEYFRAEAYEQYLDNKAEQSNTYSYYGISESDFH